jgi:hypothetical protein
LTKKPIARLAKFFTAPKKHAYSLISHNWQISNGVRGIEIVGARPTLCAIWQPYFEPGIESITAD